VGVLGHLRGHVVANDGVQAGHEHQTSKKEVRVWIFEQRGEGGMEEGGNGRVNAMEHTSRAGGS
jgi:hypothetical protein